jgi:hypothetical protein
MVEKRKPEARHPSADVRVRAALRGQLPLSALSGREDALFNAAIADAVHDDLTDGHYGEVLAARGVTAVALADDGRTVEYRPDGTTRPVAVS